MFESIQCIYIRETEKAVLVDAGWGSSETWIPKSVLEWFHDNHYQKGDSMELSVASWFCAKNDLRNVYL